MRPFQQHEAEQLRQQLADTALASMADALVNCHQQGWQRVFTHGDFARWQDAWHALPDVIPSTIDNSSAAITIGRPDDCSMPRQALVDALQRLHPWRKGPFDLFGVQIDTEWRSDWKWNRVQPEIDLRGKTVLDIGCGSGYHLWRMLGDEATLALGIDPTPLFAMQFATIKRYQPDAPAFLLPCGIEQLPANLTGFDVVFSMGILYHRRSPIDHLSALKSLIKPGGTVILETLIVEGDAERCLIPSQRYAKMRNVWFIPSVAMLTLWLKRSGFKQVDILDITPTSCQEQRATDWMRFESLADFLDPNDPSKTIEGHPAPIRAMIRAS